MGCIIRLLLLLLCCMVCLNYGAGMVGTAHNIYGSDTAHVRLMYGSCMAHPLLIDGTDRLTGCAVLLFSVSLYVLICYGHNRLIF